MSFFNYSPFLFKLKKKEDFNKTEWTHKVMEVGKVIVSPFSASAAVANGVATMLHGP